MAQSVVQDAYDSAPVIVGTAVAAAGLAVVLTWWWLRRRAAASIPGRLRRAGDDLLAAVLIPNADSGQIHIEYAVLTRQGIVVVDVRDIAGHVFGSETMQDWTVLGGNQRFTFANPLPALYDRVAAVRRLLPEVRVRGCVAFTARAEFTKGFPPNVVMLEGLIDELASASSAADAPPAEVLQAAWAKLRKEAVAAPRARPARP